MSNSSGEATPPDNVMVETSDDSSRVVLADFGVAHITGMETMTATGALVGSPAYTWDAIRRWQ